MLWDGANKTLILSMNNVNVYVDLQHVQYLIMDSFTLMRALVKRNLGKEGESPASDKYPCETSQQCYVIKQGQNQADTGIDGSTFHALSRSANREPSKRTTPSSTTIRQSNERSNNSLSNLSNQSDKKKN